MFPVRTGLIIWINDLKAVKNFEKFGSIHYISKKMSYVVLYVNSEKLDETLKIIQKYPFVKKVERSMRNEIPTDYNNMPDKTQLYPM